MDSLPVWWTLTKQLWFPLIYSISVFLKNCPFRWFTLQLVSDDNSESCCWAAVRCKSCDAVSVLWLGTAQGLFLTQSLSCFNFSFRGKYVKNLIAHQACGKGTSGSSRSIQVNGKARFSPSFFYQRYFHVHLYKFLDKKKADFQ